MVISTDDLPTELIAQIFVEALGSPGHHVNPILRRLLLQHIYLRLDLVRDQASEARCRAYIDTFVCRANKIALHVVGSGSNAYQASIWLAVHRIVGSICWSLFISVDERSQFGPAPFAYAPEVAACLDQVAPFLEALELRYGTEDLPVGAHLTLPQARNLSKLVWNTRWALDITMQVVHIFSRCPKLDTLHFDVDLRSIPPIRAESASLRRLSLLRGLEPQF
ncbi:hypothetical protein EXIGLDRAFT_839885 [Exidia glandulosa HHB12029]|uniref:F-box domain-containing protein n=1 Tax=Exidia glandulosa HHB12029 TaxID=1314781 RepID=A0A165ERK6_EXIGL|nr:hypothetical protein EXIGLDRAFT_839885 [Exidia glandulosa HHB12029]